MKKKSKSSNKNRRTFIKTSSTALGGFYFVPRHVLGRGYTAPSDQLNLAAIGAGGKGTSDIFNSWNGGVNNVVALADPDSRNASKSVERFPDAKMYKDFRFMLSEMGKDIDAVTVSTPDHLHGVAAKMAMDMGKHVYVQKPMTHNIYEARQLTLAARNNKVVTQMGNQGASNPGQVQMMEWFDKGVIGNVDEVHIWTNRPVWPQGIPVPGSEKKPAHLTDADWDLWIGPAEYVDYHPLYHSFKWRGWWNFGTGALGDMGCHLIDPAFRVLGLGYPTEVECNVGQVFKRDWNPEHIPEGCPPTSQSQIRFPASEKNPVPSTMTWYDGGIRPFHPSLIPADHSIGEDNSSNGVIMKGEKGIMTCATYGFNPKVYLNSGEILTMPEGYTGGNKYHDKPEMGHQMHWTEACKAGFGSKEHKALTSSFDYAGPLTETVLMGNLAIRSWTLTKETDRGRNFYGRKKLMWDGDKMEITNFADANQFVSRPYRRGWKLI